MALTVRDVMESDPPSVYETDTLERVLSVMRDDDLSGVAVTNEGGRCVGIITENLIAAKKHNRLPVIEHGRLVGVVTRLDVLGALVEE